MPFPSRPSATAILIVLCSMLAAREQEPVTREPTNRLVDETAALFDD